MESLANSFWVLAYREEVRIKVQAQLDIIKAEKDAVWESWPEKFPIRFNNR